jgi:hypothetical protein
VETCGRPTTFTAAVVEMLVVGSADAIVGSSATAANKQSTAARRPARRHRGYVRIVSLILRSSLYELRY